MRRKRRKLPGMRMAWEVTTFSERNSFCKVLLYNKRTFHRQLLKGYFEISMYD